MIKKIVRTSRERNNGEWRGTTYIPNTFWREYTKLLIDERTHDEANKAKVGDKVRIAETRPLSKTKRYELVEIVEEAIIL